MWELIDYKTEFIDQGYDVDIMELFLLRNKEKKEKWVSEFEYAKMKRLGLVEGV